MSNVAAILGRFWSEPSAAGAGEPVEPTRHDLTLVAFVWVGTAIELATTDHPWPLASVVVAFTSVALTWRRRRPLLVSAAVFGGSALLGIAAAAAGRAWEGPVAGFVVLIVPYSLARWASVRTAAAGLACLVSSAIVDFIRLESPIGDIVGGTTVVALTVALGGWARSAAAGRRRALETARVAERERLARDLHDTVAHHISAVLIQAQAGRAAAEHRPHAALDALQAIETEASRTLVEMRSLVHTLRQDALTPDAGRGRAPGDDPLDDRVLDDDSRNAALRAPLPGLAAVEGLATDGPPTVRVHNEFDPGGPVADTVGAAVFRIAQEGVTNARRHGRGVTSIDVTVGQRDPDRLEVIVRDDGDTIEGAVVDGFGLTGMRERAALLGGTLEAGPAPEGGWVVRSEVPLAGAARAAR